jgi:hypothetical protein
LLATLDYYASDYAGAKVRMEFALAQMRKSSPVSVAPALCLLARIELAAGESGNAESTLAESEHLYVQNDRGAHIQRWVAHGLHGVAMAAAGNTVEGDKELAFALAQVAEHGPSPSMELSELTLLSGSAARRRGDIPAALQYHRWVRVEQQRLGWLGELGATLVDAELILDGASSDADAESRDFSRSHLVPTIATLRRLAPRHPLMNTLLALEQQPHGS